MSRRSPGTQAAAGARDARTRLAATLGPAADASGAGEAEAAGITDVGEDDAYPALSLTAAFPGGDGRRNARNAVDDFGPRHGRWPEEQAPLSTWLRARTGVGAAALIGVLAAVLGVFFWWQAATGGAEVVPLSETAPAAEEAPGQPAPAASSASPGEEADAGSGTITVHVAGAVARPGVVQLPAGSRLHEAITAAGGATGTADPDRLNLAAVLEDGQKVLVPVRGEPDQVDAPAPAPGSGAGAAPGTGTGGASGGSGGGKVNLNTAGVEELGTLPRVGPVLAQRIVDWRQQHGRFKSTQELDAVEGIGPKLLAALLPLVGI